MIALLPRYYLTHNTPAGPRWAYPTPELKEPNSFGYIRRGTVEWVPTPDAAIEVTDKWIISDTALEEIAATWRPAPKYGEWTKRPEPPPGEIERKLWELAPDTPSPSTVEHYNVHDDGEGCLSCQTMRTVYYRPKIEQPLERRPFDLSDWLPLPGEPDLDPEVAWQVDDDSLTTIYGAHTAHLWPGRLVGLRDAVYHALKGDPRTSNVFRGEHVASIGHRRDMLDVYVPIPWETPRTGWVDRYGAKGQRLRGRDKVIRPIAHTLETALVVPDTLPAPTKEQAWAAWDATIAAWVDRFIPLDRVVACDACDGHGFKLAERGSSNEADDTRVPDREAKDA